VRDMATYEKPAQFSAGMKLVVVNGTVIVDGGRLNEGVFPGRPIRASLIGGFR